MLQTPSDMQASLAYDGPSSFDVVQAILRSSTASLLLLPDNMARRKFASGMPFLLHSMAKEKCLIASLPVRPRPYARCFLAICSLSLGLLMFSHDSDGILPLRWPSFAQDAFWLRRKRRSTQMPSRGVHDRRRAITALGCYIPLSHSLLSQHCRREFFSIVTIF